MTRVIPPQGTRAKQRAWQQTTEFRTAPSGTRGGLREEIGELAWEIRNLGTTVSTLDQDISDLQAKVEATTSAEDAAVTLINGIPGMITDAVNKALAAGAQPAQLQALTDLSAKLSASSTPLAAAVTANTPAAGP